jgi:hypothetical protein
MKKTLISILAMVYAVFLVSAAKSEIAISGYQEFYMGSGDQSKILSNDASTYGDTSFSGFSNGRFTRITFVGNTTLDSGINVTGTLNFSKDADDSGDSDTSNIAVDQNDIVFSGSFGNIAFGNNFSAGSMMHYRGTTLIPTAEPDNDQRNRFGTMGDDTVGFGRQDEAGFALDPIKIRYMTNVYDGFSMGVSYTPCSARGSGSASGTDCNSSTAATIQTHGAYSSLTDWVFKYETEMEGIGLGLTYGYQTGTAGVLSGTEYNDLEGTIYSAQVKVAGLTAIYRHVDLGDSGQIKTNVDDGDETSDVFAVRYDVGNFSIGYANVETEKGVTSQTANNSDSFNGLGLGYNLGGGVNIEAAYMSVEQMSGTTTETDIDIILTKLSFGF